MNERIGIIQKIIEKKSAQTYLEIGVWGGTCFLNIKAPNKIAVDPELLIPKNQKKHHHCFEMTSDDFFKKKSKFLTKNKLDVVFIDGLHTYQQVLKDINNSLKFLNNNGIIIIHDCNPPYKAAALSLTEIQNRANKKQKIHGWTGDWAGDVWKAIVHLRTTRNDLFIFVLDIDWGVGIILAGEPENRLTYSLDDIKKLTYKDFEVNRKKLLNLKNLSYLETFLSNLPILKA